VGGQYLEPQELQKNIAEQLDDLDKAFGHSTTHTTLSGRFKALIRHANQQAKQPVVVLVDEYDKPILDALQVPDVAKANRDLLRGFYATVKDSDAYVKFSFFTGVSKFAKMNIFSGLNNLTDLSLDPAFSTVCGYTDNDIQAYEGYYASVFYSYFASLGLDITVEDATNLGRIDMTLQFNQQIYIFEFKVVEMAPKGNALQQIKDKGYADKFKALGQPIYLIGVEFSKDGRNIIGFEVERV